MEEKKRDQVFSFVLVPTTNSTAVLSARNSRPKKLMIPPWFVACYTITWVICSSK
jgi:hypothetical protein